MSFNYIKWIYVKVEKGGKTLGLIIIIIIIVFKTATELCSRTSDRSPILQSDV